MLAAVDPQAFYEVKLVGVCAAEVTADSFRASIDLELSQQGEYRLVDDQGVALSDWSELGPDSAATLVSQPVPRRAGDDYELFVERRTGNELRRFQAAFKLTVTDNGAR